MSHRTCSDIPSTGLIWSMGVCSIYDGVVCLTVSISQTGLCDPGLGRGLKHFHRHRLRWCNAAMLCTFIKHLPVKVQLGHLPSSAQTTLSNANGPDQEMRINLCLHLSLLSSAVCRTLWGILHCTCKFV
eukprot:scpid108845/ scgid9715/ 